MLAPAKVNLMLHVTGKRADGYHLLQSLVMFADVGDEVSLTPSEHFALDIRGEFSGELHGDNLIAKAAHALASAAKIQPHGIITLDKKLPIGAGLGGGSSDGAAALKLLSQHWNCAISLSDAAALGSDIPACLHGAPLWMEGVGERITPLAMPFDIPLLLANPRREVPTSEVYQRRDAPYAETMKLPSHFATPGDLLAFLMATHNALEAPAMQIAPAIRTALHDLALLPGCLLSRMSGSGATCFGIFPTQEACITAAHELQTLHPNWWVRATKLQGTNKIK